MSPHPPPWNACSWHSKTSKWDMDGRLNKKTRETLFSFFFFFFFLLVSFLPPRPKISWVNRNWQFSSIGQVPCKGNPQGHNQRGAGGLPQAEAQPPLSPPNEMPLCTGVYGEPPPGYLALIKITSQDNFNCPVILIKINFN